MKRFVFFLLCLSFVMSGCNDDLPVEGPKGPTCPDCICRCTVCGDCPDCICEGSQYDSEYVSGLIREAKKCERSLYYYNISDCHGELNWTREELQSVEEECEEDYQELEWEFDECEDNLKDIDVDLKDCKKDLCEYNETFC